MKDYGLLFALIAIMAFFQIVTDGTLMRPSTSPTCSYRTAISS